jgi:hypothetical protein
MGGRRIHGEIAGWKEKYHLLSMRKKIMKISMNEWSRIWNLAYARNLAKHILNQIIDDLDGDAHLLAKAIIYPDADVPEEHKIVASRCIMRIMNYERQQKNHRQCYGPSSPNLTFRD